MATPTSSFQPPVQVKDRIELTPKEKQIFDRLKEVLVHFDLQTQLRVAGGWVRDKVGVLPPKICSLLLFKILPVWFGLFEYWRIKLEGVDEFSHRA